LSTWEKWIEDLFDDFDRAVGNTFDELIEFYRSTVEFI
jgi:hypothetical protein